MTRQHPPCSACARFVPATAGSAHCNGFDRPAQADDAPCVLFVERGSRADREQRRHQETISRASAVKERF